MIDKLVDGLVQGGPVACLAGLLILMVWWEIRKLGVMLSRKLDMWEDHCARCEAKLDVVMDRSQRPTAPSPVAPRVERAL